MSAIEFDHSAEGIALRLERAARARGLTVEGARAEIASKLGLLPGTIENLRRQRMKGVREFVANRLQAGLLREIENELRALTHEREILLRKGVRLDAREMAEVDAGLAKVRALLKSMR